MKIVESKDLIVGKKYTTLNNKNRVLEFVKHNQRTNGAYFKCTSPHIFDLDAEGLIGFPYDKEYIEIE